MILEVEIIIWHQEFDVRITDIISERENIEME